MKPDSCGKNNKSCIPIPEKSRANSLVFPPIFLQQFFPGFLVENSWKNFEISCGFENHSPPSKLCLLGVPNTSISTVYWLRRVLNPHETGLVKYPLDLNNISQDLPTMYSLFQIISPLYIYIYIYILITYQILGPIPHFFRHTKHGASFVAVHWSLARLQRLRVFAQAAVEQTAHRQLLGKKTMTITTIN